MWEEVRVKWDITCVVTIFPKTLQREKVYVTPHDPPIWPVRARAQTTERAEFSLSAQGITTSTNQDVPTQKWFHTRIEKKLYRKYKRLAITTICPKHTYIYIFFSFCILQPKLLLQFTFFLHFTLSYTLMRVLYLGLGVGRYLLYYALATRCRATHGRTCKNVGREL